MVSLDGHHRGAKPIDVLPFEAATASHTLAAGSVAATLLKKPPGVWTLQITQSSGLFYKPRGVF